jgi:FkbM family methyltransferase
MEIPIQPVERRQDMGAIAHKLQSILKRSGVYQRFKTSLLYDAYWKMKDRRWIDVRDREVEFYRQLLSGMQPGDLIFDVGANDGFKTDVFLRLGARVVAIEPDDINQEVLRNRFLRYRLSPKPVMVVGKAVSDTSSTETMLVDGPGSAVNTLSRKWADTLKGDKINFKGGNFGLDFTHTKVVKTTTLAELAQAHGEPFFVKIDVEGYEAHVLRGMKHPVPFLSFEINLPEFRPEGLECVKILEILAADGKFNYAADFQQGMALDKWLDAPDFARILDHCSEKTIEVFWKTAVHTGR